MPVIDMIFNWAKVLISSYTTIADWFLKPIAVEDFVNRLFGGVGLLLGFLDIGPGDLVAAFSPIEGFTPIELLLGPGLVVVLMITLFKWLRGILW